MRKRKTKAKKRKSGKGTSKRPVSLRKIIRAAKTSMGSGSNSISAALKSARQAVKEAGGKKKVKTPRVLPVPQKIGGFLPFLIPLFAGLSATGALAGGAAGIAKAIQNANAAQRALAESQRHNQTMEAIAVGKGLYLKPYKKGLGLHLKNV